MIIGYNLLREDHRFKGVEKDNLLAVETLVRAGCERIYVDFSLKQEKRQLIKVLSLLKTNDTLIVPRSKILGESKSSFLQRIEILQQKGVHLQSLEENYLFPSSFSLLDWLNLSLKLFPDEDLGENFQPISLPKKNDKIGRHPLPREQQELIRLLRLVRIGQKKINVTKICKLAGICRPTFYNLFPAHKKSA